MNFINKLFKKKEPSWRKEKYIPEYHKCPMCGGMVKTNATIKHTNQCYLDGESKETLKDIIDSMQFCECCGYIYDGYDYEMFIESPPDFGDEQRQIAKSTKYQAIFKNNSLEPYYKKMLLLKLTYAFDKNLTDADLYYEYKYYFENGNTEEEQKLLEKKLKVVSNDKNAGQTISGGRLCYNNKHNVRVWQKEIVIDILRRLNRFDEAKELLIQRIKEYEKEQPNDKFQQEYFAYQLKLIEAHDNKHI